MSSLFGAIAQGANNVAQSFLNFGLGQATAAIDWKREKKKMQMQQDYSLAQMAKAQEYNLSNMAKQNEYQIAAEERTNDYNDIGSQLDRARDAGVSPLAALGSGGAGGLMSVSSAPSGSMPSGSAPSGGAPRSSPGSGVDLSGSFLQRSQAGYYQELRRKVSEEARGLEFDNMWKQIDAGFAKQYENIKGLEYEVNSLRTNLEKAYVSGGMSSMLWKTWQQELNNLVSTGDNLDADTDVKTFGLLRYYSSMVNYYDTQTADTKATQSARIKQALASAFNSYKSGALAVKQAATEEERQKLVKADTAVAKARKKQVDKEVERLGKLNQFTDQQIKEIKNRISLAWAEFGVNTAVSASQEARAWIYPWTGAFNTTTTSRNVPISWDKAGNPTAFENVTHTNHTTIK